MKARATATANATGEGESAVSWADTAKADIASSHEFSTLRRQLTASLLSSLRAQSVGSLVDLSEAEQCAYVQQVFLEWVPTRDFKSFMNFARGSFDARLAHAAAEQGRTALSVAQEALTACATTPHPLSLTTYEFSFLINGFFPDALRPIVWSHMLCSDDTETATSSPETATSLIPDSSLLQSFSTRIAGTGVLDCCAKPSLRVDSHFLTSAKALLSIYFAAREAVPTDDRFKFVAYLIVPLIVAFPRDAAPSRGLHGLLRMIERRSGWAKAPRRDLDLLQRIKGQLATTSLPVHEELDVISAGNAHAALYLARWLGHCVDTLFVGRLPIDTVMHIWDSLILSKMALLLPYLTAYLVVSWPSMRAVLGSAKASLVASLDADSGMAEEDDAGSAEEDTLEEVEEEKKQKKKKKKMEEEKEEKEEEKEKEEEDTHTNKQRVAYDGHMHRIVVPFETIRAFVEQHGMAQEYRRSVSVPCWLFDSLSLNTTV